LEDRVSLIGSQATGLGSVPTAAGGRGAGGGDGTIRQITSDDGSVVVTNPNGPVTDLSVPGALEIILGQVSYGEGLQGTDDVVPVSADGVVAYMGVGMNADTIGDPTDDLDDSNRYEFAVPYDLVGLKLRVEITRLSASGESFVTVGGSVTIDGEVHNELSWGATFDGGGSVENVVQLPEWDVDVEAESTVGVTIGTLPDQADGNVQVRIVIVGVRGTIPPPPDGPFVDETLGPSLWLESQSDEGWEIEVDVDDGIDRVPNRAVMTGSASDAGPYPNPDAPSGAIDKAVLVPAAVNGHDAIEMAPGRILSNDQANVHAAGVDDYSTPIHEFYLVVPSALSNGGPLGTIEVNSANHTYWQAPHLREIAGTQYVYSSKGLLQGTIDANATPFASYLGQLVMVESVVRNDGTHEIYINGVLQTLSSDVPGDIGTGEDFQGYAVGSFLDLSLLASGFTGLIVGRMSYRGSLIDDAPAGRLQTYNYWVDKYGPLGVI
jgi:hypothetical protein